MRSLLTSSFLAAALVVVAPAVAQDDSTQNYDTSACVDKDGFESCINTANTAYTDCVNQNCKDQNLDCISVCECVQTADHSDCFGQSCWNQVS